MKTIVRKLLPILLVAAILVFTLASCNGGVDDEGTCRVVLADGEDITEYTVNLSEVEGDEGLFSVLDALNKNGMPLVTRDGAYGKELISVGSLVPDPLKREYIRILTSVESDFDTSTWFYETEYDGVRLGTSGFGASGMTIKKDGVFYLEITTY